MSLEQIGQKLKAAREGQGLSLRQIYERTKIPMGHLLSIDGAQADELPEPVYVAGFIRRYAECVGLDGQSLADEYRKLFEEPVGNGNTKTKSAVKNANGQTLIYTQPEYYRSSKVDRGGPPTFKTFYFNAFWIVVVVGLLSYLVKVQLNNQATQMDPSLVALRESTAKYNAAQLPATQTQTNQTAQPAADKDQGDAKIALSASQHVWVEVKSMSSGESLYTGYLEQGDRRDFQDPQGLRVRAGNGGSLTVDYQGKIGTFGDSGKIAERTFVSAKGASAIASDPTKDASKQASTVANAAKPLAGVKKTVRKNDERRLSEAHERRYRNVDDVPSRQYIPGESLGGGARSIDVPYRYSEGRLDAE
jgi:cytoskeletal protein RodZ